MTLIERVIPLSVCLITLRRLVMTLTKPLRVITNLLRVMERSHFSHIKPKFV